MEGGRGAAREAMNPQSQKRKYRVRVGHTTVVVEAASAEEAIREARRQLCHEMPRMWDVIQSLETTRFEVQLHDWDAPPGR